MSEYIEWLGVDRDTLAAKVREIMDVSGEREEKVVKKILDMNASLKPLFKQWWVSGNIPDTQEYEGLTLKDLIIGHKGVRKHTIIGAFINFDWLIQNPKDVARTLRAPVDFMFSSKDKNSPFKHFIK